MVESNWFHHISSTKYIFPFLSWDCFGTVPFYVQPILDYIVCTLHLKGFIQWPRGLMDKASDFESEDCEFESRRGRIIILFLFIVGVLYVSRSGVLDVTEIMWLYEIYFDVVLVKSVITIWQCDSEQNRKIYELIKYSVKSSTL